MADKTVNEGLLDTVKELKETNKRLSKAQETFVLQNKVGGKIGDAVLENAKKSTEGLNVFHRTIRTNVSIWCNIWYW